MEMATVVTALAAVAAILFVAGAAIFLTAPQERSARDLLADDARGTERRERGEGMIVRRLLPPAPPFVLARSDLGAIDRRLREAGRPYGFSATEFVRFRLLSAILVAVIALLLFSGSEPLVTIVVVIAFAAGGYALPQLWLAGVAQGRTKQLNGALPDMVDSLALALDAGMDLEAAV
ncbi:MAG: hypothetical protein KGQ88_10080, partial [Chloroflexi bacterium]|nr:hypothetical protein [Chloroflexota bacterium]